MPDPIIEIEDTNAPDPNDGGETTEDGQPIDTALETATDQSVENGKVTRLEQEVAKYAKVLNGLGINPDSDFADRFNAGLVTKSDVARQLGVEPQPVGQPVAAPAQSLSYEDQMSELITKVNADGATAEDFGKSLELMNNYMKEVKGQEQANSQQQLFNQCVAATQEVLDEDANYAKMPDEIKQIESQMFVASTDHLLAQQAQKTKNPESYITPDAYRFYAKQNQENMTKLRDYWRAEGKAAGDGNPAPLLPGQTAPVNPLSPNAGGPPVNQPRERVTLKNMDRLAQAYFDNARQA
jgi:hypothetical protein